MGPKFDESAKKLIWHSIILEQVSVISGELQSLADYSIGLNNRARLHNIWTFEKEEFGSRSLKQGSGTEPPLEPPRSSVCFSKKCRNVQDLAHL